MWRRAPFAGWRSLLLLLRCLFQRGTGRVLQSFHRLALDAAEEADLRHLPEIA
jgi:hypothetical protein